MKNLETVRHYDPTPLSVLTLQLIHETTDILLRAGAGHLSPSAYDTAWVARIPAEQDPSRPMFPRCLQWLLEHQHHDGSWGSPPGQAHYYDNIICTLAALVTLKTWQNKGLVPEEPVRRATAWLNQAMQLPDVRIYRTVGFELLFPALFQQALELGVALTGGGMAANMEAVRAAKLEKIGISSALEKPTTLLHSLEGLPPQAISWEKALRLQDRGGSFLTSPSATAFVYLHTKDPACLAYLQQVLDIYGHVPVGHPLDVFELCWCLEIIASLGLTRYFEAVYNDKIAVLQSHWRPATGISWSSAFDLPDLDDTAVAYYLLHKSGRQPDLSVFRHFFQDNRFFCFPGELDSSPTHLLHFLQAYNGKDARLAEAARRQLLPLLQGNWTDKWHLSPYYLTCIAVMPLQQTAPDMINRMIRFITDNQHPDGGWGQQGSNAEETGWACMTLLLYLSHYRVSNTVINHCLHKGISFLAAARADPLSRQRPDLWIEKCLYTPHHIVDTLINAVLLKYYLNHHNTNYDYQ